MASSATQKANQANIAAQEAANRKSEAFRDQDFQRQEHFAKHGIQWRAQDAAAAGIHPLYALGASTPTFSPSPVSVGSPTIAADTSMGSAVASMGQDIGRAINSTRTADQRDAAYVKTVQDLSLQKMGLENTLLASQIKRLQVNDNPPFPSATASQNNPTTAVATPVFPPNWSIPEDKVSPRPQIIIGGKKWDTDPRTSTGQDVTNLVGDEGPAPMIINSILGMQHLKHHLEKNTHIKYSKPTSWRDYLPSFSWTR